MELHCYRIIGIVQGVGFRPFIHKLATKYALNGWILNDSEGVLIEVEGDGNLIKSFVEEVKTSPPPMARIDNVMEVPGNNPPGTNKGFFIKESVKMNETKTLIPPDSFVCEDCIRELFDESNRRYRYPFINCTNCGPRYSIIKEMPYDRGKTTMKDFIMCSDCQREYHDINDRRYHAQPNACPVCGPALELRDNTGNILEVDDIIEFSKRKLQEGKIFGVKSIGGFHLAVNALDDQAVRLLRNRKKRDSKPFALMVKNIETAQRYVDLCSEEIELLKSVQRPIVILKKKPGVLPDSIAPNNPNYGLMLPSAPLHYLLLDEQSLPVLIMTSGNISGQPIEYKNEGALVRLSPIVDYYILNNRDIHIRVDDSIVRCINHASLEKKIVTHIRRSRGFAPYPIKVHKNVNSILALGSELKATTALSKNGEIFVSQHIGDVKNDEIYKSLIHCSEHMQNLLSIEPELIACDLHPSFRTNIAAKGQDKLPVIQVQHHHAHMASCMAENKINTKVLGVIFDGTGYGLDGTIWGGEVLVGDYASFERAACLSPFFLLGGDKAVKEPFRVAIDLLYRTFGEELSELNLDFLKRLGQDEISVYCKMAKGKINAFQTSSMGRLFDGISALLNICLKIEYEAQAAIELESLLNRDFTLGEPFKYDIIKNKEHYEIDYRPMIREMVAILNKSGCDAAYLSRRFHSTIVNIVGRICSILRECYSINEVVLSGGVFMNEYLAANTILNLKQFDFNVYHNSLVPTNDGGISLGQIMVANAKANLNVL
jgi:hydrogenase maturation protein HypF